MALKLLSVETTLACYPDDGVADQIERDIELTLPKIASLTSNMSDEQRLTVFQSEASKSRAAFCAIHGDPFGIDEQEILAPKPKCFFDWVKASIPPTLRFESEHY